VATKKQRKHREKHDERAALANKLELAKGMKVMVTFNVETDLDVANGARGEIVEIVLDERETAFSPTAPIVELTYPPAYILVKMSRTKAVQLEGLEKDVLPLVPLERTFSIVHGKGLKTIRRRQLPVTPAYSFTDYRSQGQTISHSIIDIATPPSGGLTPFNVYVALSRGRGRDNIRLLRDFDEKLLMSHPCEYLRVEDERLMRLDVETEKWWNQKTPKSGEELM
jgi:ATP-dependent exoDNAse (exonuclease V) alpha subunit